MLNTLLNIIAPHECLVCTTEGFVLCLPCQMNVPPPVRRCFRCMKLVNDFMVCTSCTTATGIKSVWVCGEYKDVLARLIKEYKFEHVRSASGDLAHMLHSRLPVLKPNTIITYVPTASSRVRMRGFDHAQLLAKQLAKKRATLHAPLLGRTSQARQLGNSRLTRQVAIQGEFFIKNQSLVKNADILLVDDVITTGATVIEAARVLKQAGARSVWVAVIAQTML